MILEGLAREAVSRIQKTRKEEGLNVSDRLDLHLSCDNEDLFEALNIHKAYISSEVVAEKLSLKKEDKASTGLKASKSFDLEGKNLNVAFNVV